MGGMRSNATNRTAGRWTPRAGDVAMSVFVACMAALLLWGFGQVSHYELLDDARRGIVCERGLSLLASEDPAAVARGTGIVRGEGCPIMLRADGTVPVSTAKRDAFIARNPDELGKLDGLVKLDGLDELMTLGRGSRSSAGQGFAGPNFTGPNFTGPSYADPFLWTVGAMTLGILLIGWVMLRWHGLLYDKDGQPR